MTEKEEKVEKKVIGLLGSRADIYYNKNNEVIHIERSNNLDPTILNTIIGSFTLEDFIFEMKLLQLVAINIGKYEVEFCNNSGIRWSLRRLTNETKYHLISLIEKTDLFTSKFKDTFEIETIMGNSCDDEKAELCAEPSEDFYEGADWDRALAFEQRVFILKDITDKAVLHRFSSNQLSFHIPDEDGRTKFCFGVDYESNLEGLLMLADEGYISSISVGKFLAGRLVKIERWKKEYEERMQKFKPYLEFYDSLDDSMKLLVEMEKDSREKSDGRDRCYESAGC